MVENIQKQRKTYTVVVEGTVPIKLTFEVIAFDEIEAFQILEKHPKLLKLKFSPEIVLPRLRKIKATIRETLTSLIKMVKNY